MIRIQRIIFLFYFLLIGCASSSKYDELKQSCDEKEKKMQEELNLVKANSVQKDEEHKNELKSRQDKFNDLLRERISLRSSMNRIEGSVDELTEEKKEMAQALEELRKRKEESEARIAEFKGLLDKFKSFISAGKLKIKVIDGRMVIALSSDVLFASGSKKLSFGGKQAISEVTEILASIENRKFQIEGHTDSDRFRVIGQTNWDLAADRAINVLNRMIRSGMPESKISAASFGDSRPLVPNDSKENKAQNRRIEIVVVPDLSLLPGYEDLKKMTKNTVQEKPIKDMIAGSTEDNRE